jgi:aspartate aminotransferase-like enzyme
MSNAILLAPGPVQLHPEVQRILAQPMIHHRTPEFDGILARVLQNLKSFFQTKMPVLIQTSTGSGGMEALLVNLLNPGEEVLALVTGKFGERWAEMAEVYGARVHRLNSDWGKPADPEKVRIILKDNPNIKLVLTQATETSTATAHDVQKLADIVSKTDALLLVDGITAVGAYDIKMDDWKIDGLVAGSQKAVMLPTGLSFVCLSERAWEKVKTCKTPRYYFDLQRELKANQKGETFFSSAVAHIKALDFVLSDISKKGLAKHFAEQKRRADFTRALAPQMGLSLYSASPSDSVTGLIVPEGVDGAKLREHLEKKYLVTVMGGQDQAKGKIIRIGHMGYIQDNDMIETMYRLALALKDFSFNIDPEKVKAASMSWLKAHPLE